MTLLGYPFISSPNQSSRKGIDITGVMIHYTAGGSARGSVSWLCNPAAKASAHFVISRGGDGPQVGSVDGQAWRTGVTEITVNGEMKSDASLYTIGIELANHGMVLRIK